MEHLYLNFPDSNVYLVRHKDEAFEMFLSYKAEVENQLIKKS